MCASKKGISAHQIHRMLGVTYKSAWFLCHRIRFAMKQEPLAGMLSGVVEIDETYVGGKPRKLRWGKNKAGRGTEKAPVMVLIQRDGEAVCKPMQRVDLKTVKANILENVDPNATICTDELSVYTHLRYTHDHEVIKHGIRNYSRKRKSDGLRVHVNTAESFFSLLKRGHYGTFHQLSKHHLHRYCDEFAFRWKHRKADDGERTDTAIAGAEGKRLQYKGPVAGLTG